MEQWIQSLDLEPDKELSDQISLAILICLKLPGIVSRLGS